MNLLAYSILASISFIIWLFSQDLLQASKFLAFILAFNLLPSLALLELLFPRWRHQASPTLLLAGFSPVAAAIFILPLWAIDLEWGYFLIPVASILLLLTRKIRFGAFESEPHRWPDVLCIAGSLLGASLVSLALAWTENLNPHLLHQAALAAKLDVGYPPESALVAGVPLTYNYVAHVWLSASSFITGLPIETLVAYAAPAVLLYCSACAMASLGFCARLPSWITGLVICCVFWVAGWTHIGTQLFGRAITWSCVLLIGPLMAFSAFFVLIQALACWWEDVNAPSWRSYVFAFLVMVVLVGSRAPGAIVLLCAASFLIAWDAIARRRLNAFAFGVLAVLGATTVLGLVVFLGYGGKFNPGGFTTVSATPFAYLASFSFFWLPTLLVSHGWPPVAAGALQFVALAVFQAGFLTPFLISTPLRWSPLEILLAGSGLAGIAAVFFLQSGGGSQFTFLHYTTLSFSLLGGIALANAINARRRFFAVAVALAAVLAVLQLSELPLVGLKGMILRWKAPDSPERLLTRHLNAWSDQTTDSVEDVAIEDESTSARLAQ